MELLFSGIGTHSALDVFNAGISVKNGSTSAGFIELFEDSITNGTNKATLIGPASTDDVTITLPAATDTLVGKATTDTLSNKTLTNPTINAAALSGTLSGTPTFSGIGTHSALDVFNAGISVKNGSTSAGFIELFEDSTNGTNKATLIGPASTDDVTITLPAATDTLVGKATTDTLSNKTLTNPTINAAALSGTLSGTPTFSGIGTHSALDVFNAGISVKNGSTSAGFIELFEDSTNGTNKATLIGPASTDDVTITLPAATDTLVGKATTDTLSNKTLTNPTINAAALSGTFSGTPTFSGIGTHSALDVFNAGISVKNGSTSAGFIELFEDSTNGTNKATLIGPASTDDVTITLPAATDTLVGKATTDTLSNKTLTSPKINVIEFEGSTADSYETTLGVVDPTADRTINIANASGTLIPFDAASTTVITSTPEELNILDGVTATTAELNILDGVTATAAELNVLDGITAVVGELNALDLGNTAVGTAIASKAVILDSNKDYTGIRNLTTGSVNGNVNGIIGDTSQYSGTFLTLTSNSGGVNVKNGDLSGGTIKVYERTSLGSNFVGLKAPDSITSDITFTLPSADGSANQVLKTDGSGVLGWTDGGGSVSGNTFATI